MRKGIFWCKNYDTEFPELIIISADCDKNGNLKESVQFSSESGDNFNHKFEWKKLLRKVTGGHPYNYYPRGRVEIKSGKSTVFLNPTINKDCIIRRIIDEFDLMTEDLTDVIIKNDGSNHYRFTCGSSNVQETENVVQKAHHGRKNHGYL